MFGPNKKAKWQEIANTPITPAEPWAQDRIDDDEYGNLGVPKSKAIPDYIIEFAAYLIIAAGIAGVRCTYQAVTTQYAPDVCIQKLDSAVRSKSRGDGAYTQWLVFTDHGTFENADAWAYLKFDSTSFQQTLEVGGLYNFTFYGIATGADGQYPNIVSAEKVGSCKVKKADKKPD